jgi:hypothetical protein
MDEKSKQQKALGRLVAKNLGRGTLKIMMDGEMIGGCSDPSARPLVFVYLFIWGFGVLPDPRLVFFAYC